MAQSDAEKWNKRYRGTQPDFTPDSFLLEYANLLDGDGEALDLACGVGHNTIWLAEKGYAATGIDVSHEGIKLGQNEAEKRVLTLNLIAADLDDYVLPQERYDVVLVIRFLHRPLLPQINQTLKSGGLLLYKTFNIKHCEETDFPAGYALQPLELINAFADFEIMKTNDGKNLAMPQTYLVARKRSIRSGLSA